MDKFELVKLCKDGNRDAMECLYRTYARGMMKIVRRYVADASDAEDVLHDGFILVLTRINDLREADKLESWMGMIMRNLSLNRIRETGATVRLDDSVEVEEGPESPDLIPFEELERIMDRLPAGYGKVFRLAALEGKSHKEIGRMLGIAPHSVSSQLYRARRMMQRMVTEYRLRVVMALLLLLPLAVSLMLLRSPEKDALRAESGTKETPMPQGKEVTDFRPLVAVTPREIAGKVVASSDLYTIIGGMAPQDLHQKADGTEEMEDKPDTADMVFPAHTSISQLRQDPQNGRFMQSDPDAGKWSLAVAYSSSTGSGTASLASGVPNVFSSSASIGGPGMSDITRERVRHHMPLTIGLRASRAVNDRLTVGTGLSYTCLKSDVIRQSDISTSEWTVRTHYVSIPLKADYRLFSAGRLDFYGTAGVGMDIPVKTEVSGGKGRDLSGTAAPSATSASVQFSLTIGAGMQYPLTQGVSVYVEPSVECHFGEDSSVPTLWDEHPVTFSLPVGLRFSW